jgi:hypothetical protein
MPTPRRRKRRLRIVGRATERRAQAGIGKADVDLVVERVVDPAGVFLGAPIPHQKLASYEGLTNPAGQPLRDQPHDDIRPAAGSKADMMCTTRAGQARAQRMCGAADGFLRHAWAFAVPEGRPAA